MKKTDNSYFEEKVLLRLEVLSLIDKKNVNILEAFAGEGLLWKEVEARTDKKLNILRVEKEKGKNKRAHIQGDNLKVLSGIPLQDFDIIDLDAYGIPYRQLKILRQKGYRGIVIITAIQSGMGRLPNMMLKELGYTDTMIKKIPTIFSKKGFTVLKNLLYLYGVKNITGYFFGRKNYFYFELT